MQMFEMCRCSYTEEHHPSWSATAALALGLLGGLTAALKTGIGIVGGTCAKKFGDGGDSKADVSPDSVKGEVEIAAVDETA